MEITIIGTSHIAQESVKEITETILREKPDIVAVELDVPRYYALQERHSRKKKGISWYALKKVGLKGFLFALIGSWISQKLGKSVGVMPGEDMLTAVKVARQHHLEVALIDQPIETTLKRISQTLTWKEKWQFIVDIFNALFFRERELRKVGISTLDLHKVPSKTVIKRLIAQVKQRYPSLYRVLIAERNRYMVQRLRALAVQHPSKKILAVVGAGHEDDMKQMLHRIDIVGKS